MYDDPNDPDLTIRKGSNPQAQQTMLAALENAWWALAPGEGVPMRREVSSLTMGAALPYGFIAEQIAPGHARFRVAGRKICEMMGCEARGMPLSCMFNAGARSDFATILGQVFDGPALADIPLRAPRGFGRAQLNGRMLILPLANDDGIVNRAMGAVVLDGPSGGSVRRCDIPAAMPSRLEKVTNLKAPVPEQKGAANVTVLPRPRLPFGKAHLRLVVDNG